MIKYPKKQKKLIIAGLSAVAPLVLSAQVAQPFQKNYLK